MEELEMQIKESLAWCKQSFMSNSGERVEDQSAERKAATMTDLSGFQREQGLCWDLD